ncbi:MAG: pantetheine-phosphate adenylyltransferase [Nitrospirota bacterium]|jgi:pantetheine-phosphate adenylyltransferase
MSKRAVYPGTFDPFTNGHLYTIERSLKIVDEVLIAVAHNPAKKTLFSLNERVALIEEAMKDEGRVRVEPFDSLLVEFARSRDASLIIRGLRAVSDFEYEFQMALMNRKLASDLETIFVMPSLRYIFLSSTIVKEVASYGGSVDGLVPANVEAALKEKFKSSAGRDG